MKKFIKTFILVLCLVLPTFCLTACDNAEHEHNFATEWSSDASYHYHACTGDDCEEITDKEAHTFGEWTTSTKATCTTNGEKYRECSKCEYKETQEIPATGHTFGEFIIDETPTTQSAGEGHRECSVCHYKIGTTISALKSTGLAFELNSDKASYTLSGIGSCSDTFVNVPNTHNGLPVTAIKNEAFRGNTTITGIVLTNNITTIGQNAFTNCSNLTNITIPNSVTHIEKYAFSNCSNLTSVTIPNNVTLIEEGVFWGCSSLTSIIIPNNVTKIGVGAFDKCSGLISVIIPNSVIEIELLSFYDCSNLKNIYFTGTTEQWKLIDFKNDNELNSTTTYFYSETIPQELGSNFWHYDENGDPKIWPAHTEHSYGEWEKDETNHWRVCSYCGFEDKNTHSFSENYSNNETNHWHECVCGAHDEDVAHTFKNGICDDCNFERIELAFNYLESSNSYEVSGIGRITSNEIVIPATYDDGTHGTLAVTSIKNSAFKEKTTITSITIPNSITKIESNAFYGCTGLNGSVVIPDSVTKMGSYVFYRCSNLKSVTIGSGLEKILSSAFTGCSSLTTVSMGNNIKEIVTYAFQECSSLTSIVIPNSVTKIGMSAFSQCGLTSIVIPNNVTELEENVFGGCSSLTSVVIGSGITYIDKTHFYNCSSIKKVYYHGNKEALTISEQSVIHDVTKYYYSETQPTTEGNYWHYVDGVPTAW